MLLAFILSWVYFKKNYVYTNQTRLDIKIKFCLKVSKRISHCDTVSIKCFPNLLTGSIHWNPKAIKTWVCLSKIYPGPVCRKLVDTYCLLRCTTQPDIHQACVYSNSWVKNIYLLKVWHEVNGKYVKNDQ